jgi:hypothetical protein
MPRAHPHVLYGERSSSSVVLFIHDPITLLLIIVKLAVPDTMKFLSLLLIPALVAAQDITISNVQYSGNGCPQGTVSTSISSDKTVSLSCPYMSHMRSCSFFEGD